MSTPNYNVSNECSRLSFDQAELLRAQALAVGATALRGASLEAGLRLETAMSFELGNEFPDMPTHVVTWPGVEDAGSACIYAGSVTRPDPHYFIMTQEAEGSYSAKGIILGASGAGSYYIKTTFPALEPQVPVASALDRFAKIYRNAERQPHQKRSLRAHGITATKVEHISRNLLSYITNAHVRRPNSPYQHHSDPAYRLANSLFGYLLMLGTEDATGVVTFARTDDDSRVHVQGVALPSQDRIVTIHQPSYPEPFIVITDIAKPYQEGAPVIASQFRVGPHASYFQAVDFAPQENNISELLDALPHFDSEFEQVRYVQDSYIENNSHEVAFMRRLLAGLLQEHGFNLHV